MDLYAKRPLGEGIYIHTLYFTVRQVALPVQVQVRAGGRRQLAFSMGVAPAFSLTKVNGSPESLALANPGIFNCGDGITSTYQHYYRENIPTRQLQLLYTAGLHYRPDARNALGLEFWLAPKLKEARLNPTLYGYGYYPDAYRKLYRMRSLQVSLRHSW